MVATVAIATLTDSFASALRWLGGRTARSHIPKSMPPKRVPNTIKAVTTTFMLQPKLKPRSDESENAVPVNPLSDNAEFGRLPACLRPTLINRFHPSSIE
jgi:hypothetical protein